MIKFKKALKIISIAFLGMAVSLTAIPFLVSCSNTNPKKDTNTGDDQSKPEINPNIIVDETNTYKFDKSTNTLLGFSEEYKNKLLSSESKPVLLDITIPGQIYGFDVLNIGQSAFANESFKNNDYEISKLNLNNNLINIDIAAFSGNQIESLIIPNSVEKIGKLAFYESKIQSVVFGESLIEIGERAFEFNKIEKITNNSKKLKNIGKGAFSENKLSTLDWWPTTINEIPERCFESNYLRTIIIPDNVTKIKTQAFHNQYPILSNVINKKPELILSKNLVQIEDEAFNSCFNSGNINGINYNFISKISIPKSIKNIGKKAFYNNDYVNDIILDKEAIFVAEKMAFAGGRTPFESIYIPKGVSLGEGCFYDTIGNNTKITIDKDFDLDLYFNSEDNRWEAAANQSRLGYALFSYGTNGLNGIYVKPKNLSLPNILMKSSSTTNKWGLSAQTWLDWYYFNQ